MFPEYGKQMAPALSIVVPVFAVEEYLDQCLDSIRAGLTAAERDLVEIIAVDDASPDRCGAMLDAYAKRHGDVRVVHLARNVGLGLARNAGSRPSPSTTGCKPGRPNAMSTRGCGTGCSP